MISKTTRTLLEAISNLYICLTDIRRWMITNKLKINDSKTEFIVFRSPQLKCDLSGLSVNVGESMITQSSKVRDLESYSTNFSTSMTILLLYVEAHIFILETLAKLEIYYRMMLVLHALISCRLDYCNSILYNGPRSKTDRLQILQNQCARIVTKSPRREHITPVLKKCIGWKFKIESYITFWCLHINHITIWHRLIYVNWLTKNKVMWILAWELINDHP